MKLVKFSYKKVMSTNKIALKKIKNGFKQGIVISEQQTKGKGRYGRKWISTKGNLFVSIFFTISPKFNIKKLTRLNNKLIITILRTLIKKKLSLKAPNDILINGKKVCGILQEVFRYKNKNFLIVGIGVNIKNSPIVNEYDTTYLNNYADKNIPINKIYLKFKKIYERNISNLYLCI